MKGPNCRGIFLLIPPLVIPWEPMEALVDWCLLFQSSHFLRKFPIRNGLSFPIGKGMETKNKRQKDFLAPLPSLSPPQALERMDGGEAPSRDPSQRCHRPQPPLSLVYFPCLYLSSSPAVSSLQRRE